tara:strand:+ start:1297 stop:2244 length:948 start_codon:yes stop_codon:yes gene_type:complete
MGQLVKGEWQTESQLGAHENGKFKRNTTSFRNQLTPEELTQEPGRYHLYIAHACPWCHRTMIMHALKQLEEWIPVHIVAPHMGEHGWAFNGKDELTGAQYMHELYTQADPDYTGRVTVPVLWDSKEQTIVNNESSEIMRLFNAVHAHNDADCYPPQHREAIDAVNERVYHTVNNGVYKAGFATTQDAYDEAYGELFDSLDWLEETLAAQRYLVGNTLTEADWRLFVTLVRFDAVYATHFKCNKRRIADYPNLAGYLRELYQVPGIADTVQMDQIKEHYYTSHPHVNPTRIIARGFDFDFEAAHDREKRGPAKAAA